jgi:hypothetical protein
VEIVKRSDMSKFVALPKRWIVEPAIGWLNRRRRSTKDWECPNRNGFVLLPEKDVESKLDSPGVNIRC